MASNELGMNTHFNLTDNRRSSRIKKVRIFRDTLLLFVNFIVECNILSFNSLFLRGNGTTVLMRYCHSILHTYKSSVHILFIIFEGILCLLR